MLDQAAMRRRPAPTASRSPSRTVAIDVVPIQAMCILAAMIGDDMAGLVLTQAPCALASRVAGGTARSVSAGAAPPDDTGHT